MVGPGLTAGCGAQRIGVDGLRTKIYAMSEDKQRWLDRLIAGITAAGTLALAIIALVATNTVYISSTPQATVTQTVTRTVTGPTGPTPPAAAPAAIGLTELNDNQDVQFSVDADFSTRNIAGTDYTDAVTGLVYSDNSGFDHLSIQTKGRFSAMSFTVGIDSAAQCPHASAQVSIEDAAGAYLWPPHTVTIDSPQSTMISIPNPIQVVLKQTSLTGDNACGNGEAQVSWGGVVFHST
jgi:hypothetical protein